MCDEFCAGCAVYGKSTGTCNYLLVMDIPRGCPAGAGCDKKISKKELKIMGMPKAWDKAAGKQMWAQGIGDAEIAKAMGVTQGTINYFRKKHWEPELAAAAERAQDATVDQVLADEPVLPAPPKSGMKRWLRPRPLPMLGTNSCSKRWKKLPAT